MKRLALLLALAAGNVSATSVKDPFDRNDGERLPNANDRLEAKGLSIPSAAEVAQFRFWEGSQYLREAARTEGIYRHPVSRTEGEAVLALLGKTEDWTLFGAENYLKPVREIDMVLTNGIVRTFRFWGQSGLIVLSDDRVFFADFHLPAPVFSAIDERMTAWRVDVVESEKTWYRKLPLPREYRAHDGADNGTLSGIAALFYGNGSKWRIIWEANKTVLPDPNIVRPGLKLTIPALNAAPATNAPAVDESHAENAESAEPNPHAESARAGDSVTNAAPSFSRRVPLDGFGSAEISPGWRISYGPDEATLDGIPKWSVCVYETAAPLDNRLLPERWHGLQPCEIAPALVPTNEVRVLPVRGKPWLLRLSLEGIGVADGKNVRGEVAMSFHRLATNAPAPHAETAEGAKEPAP